MARDASGAGIKTEHGDCGSGNAPVLSQTGDNHLAAESPSESVVSPGAETSKERTDRQFVELMNELRVALPGAQFLFAFLLAVPFAAQFSTVQHGSRVVFLACLLCTVAATILLMAPTVYHRVRWQRGNKTEVIRIAHGMFLAGMTSLGLAMIMAVWFLSDFLLGSAAAAAATAVSLGLITVTWCVLPLLGRRHPGAAE